MAPVQLFATGRHGIVKVDGALASEMSIERDKSSLFRYLRKEINDEKVLVAMEQVPRELFVSRECRHLAYKDTAQPIGAGQTISQPFIVALMTSALELRGLERVMELGTGSGYQAAILSRLVPQGRVLSLERIPSLANEAADLLRQLECSNVIVRTSGGTLGCPEAAPFDAIVVGAAAPRLPLSLLDQMALGGRMVIPIGTLKDQELVKVLKTSEGPSLRMLGPCRFVPLIDKEAWPEDFGEL